MKKYYIILISLYFALNTLNAQQLPINNQYLINRYSLSPTYAGINENPEVFLGYRKERVGFPGSTLLNMVNINAPIHDKMGLGVSIVSDRTHIFKHLYATMSYAYHAKLSENHNLSFSLFAGIYENRLDFSTTNFETIMNDPLVNEKLNQKGTGLFTGAGLLYRFKSLHLGLDVPNVYESKLNFDSEENNIEYILKRIYVGHLSYLFNVGDNWQIEPIVLSRNTPNTPLNWEGAALIKYKRNYWLGFNYRASGDMGVSIGGKINNKICLNYTYEFSNQGITGRSSGTHELGFGYIIGKRSSQPVSTEYTPVDDSRIDSINSRIDKLESDIEDLKKVSDAKIQSKVNDLEKELALLKSEIDKKKDKDVEIFTTDSTGVSKDKTVMDNNQVESSEKSYYIIIESYRNKEFADRGVEIWKEKGYETTQIHVKGWYHLYTDKYTDHATARKKLREIRAKGISKAWIVQY